MRKKLSLFIISLILMLQCTLSFGAVNAFAAGGVTVRDSAGNSLFSASVENADATAALESAFHYVQKNADSNHRLTVRLSAGSYKITKGVVLRSYCTLDLQDVTLYNACIGPGNIFISPNENRTGQAYTAYDALTDFTMLGGTLDYAAENWGESCLMRLAHCRNITVQKVEFLNNRNSHMVEIAACKNTVFDSCTFQGQTYEDSTNSSEALQIDILEPDAHFSGFPVYDGTMNDTITVKNCMFKDLYAGVGTRSAFIGKYQKNITITGNTFDNIRRSAIVCTNYVQCRITDNVIKRTGMGISFYMKKNSGQYCFFYDENGMLDGARSTNCASEISGNTISVKATDIVSQPRGIYVYGGVMDYANCPAGDYAVYKLNICKNKVTSAGGGISVVDLQSSVISGNTVSHTGSYTETTVGICLNASDKNQVSGNKVTAFDQAIKCYKASSGNKIRSNTAFKSRSHAVYILQSDSNTLTDNRIGTAGGNGIYLSESTGITLQSNAVADAKEQGIYLKKSKATAKANSLRSNKKYGVYADSSSQLSSYTNRFSSNKLGSAYAQGKTSYRFLNLNKPAAPTFSVDKKKKYITVSWKKVSGATHYDIYRATSKNGSYQKLAQVKAKTSYKDSSKIQKGKTYYYKIVAVRKMNGVTLYSSYSSVQSRKV